VRRRYRPSCRGGLKFPIRTKRNTTELSNKTSRDVLEALASTGGYRLGHASDELRARACADGEVPERSIGAVSKTVVPFAGYRGFESLPLRQTASDFSQFWALNCNAATRATGGPSHASGEPAAPLKVGSTTSPPLVAEDLPKRYDRDWAFGIRLIIAEQRSGTRHGDRSTLVGPCGETAS
jgi:hypothetical protein